MDGCQLGKYYFLSLMQRFWGFLPSEVSGSLEEMLRVKRWGFLDFLGTRGQRSGGSGSSYCTGMFLTESL